METPPLSPDLTRLALRHLGMEAGAPDLRTLDALLGAYTRRVPWESASRIAKRARTRKLTDRPRWPEEFWTDAATHGTGGTCFESNYAFFGLLRSLGFEGYLTVNNMGETTGCHTAIVVRLEGARWLVDAGFPVYTPLQLLGDAPIEGWSPYQTYTLEPLPDRRYELWRAPHPSPYCFTLLDRPVPDADYRAATTRDYGRGGLFLDQVIVTKVVDGQIWRFASRERPYQLVTFHGGERTDHPIDGDVAETVGRHFRIDAEIVWTALAHVP